MGNIYLPYQKPPRWNISRAEIALNCAQMGLPIPVVTISAWENSGNKAFSLTEIGANAYVTLTNTSWFSSALSFDGSTSYGKRTSNVPGQSNGIAIFARVYLKSIVSGQNRAIAFNWDGGGGLAWLFRINGSDESSPGVMHFGSQNDGSWQSGNESSGDTAIALNQWVTVGIRCDLVTHNFFYNGILDGSNAISEPSIYTGNPNIYIGCENQSNHWWYGYIDCLYIWDGNNMPTNAGFSVLHNNPHGMLEPIRWPTWYVSANGVIDTDHLMIMGM